MLENLFHTFKSSPKIEFKSFSVAHGLIRLPPSRDCQIEVRARSSTRKTLGDQGDFLKILSQVPTPKPNARGAHRPKKKVAKTRLA